MIQHEHENSNGDAGDEGIGGGDHTGSPISGSPISAARRGTVRAIAPISVVAIVAAGAALAPQFASAAPSLPPITAQNLLVKATQSHVDTYSGTVALTTNLGLPALPNLAGGANPLSLFSGTHTLQVAANGPDKQRVALLDTMSEYDFVHNGTQVWLYDSQHNSVEHATLDGKGTDAKSKAELQKARSNAKGLAQAPLTPQEAAQRLLAAIDPSTNVSVDGTKSVAGRAAYTLVLTPRQHGSLIGRITMAIDAQNGAPLQLAVYPAGSTTPAFELGFTSVSFSAPSDSQFDFTAPKGATVKDLNGANKQPSQDGGMLSNGGDLKPQVLGRDWLSVVELHGVSLSDLTSAAQSSGGSAGKGSRHGGNATGLFNGDISSYLNTLIGAGKSVHGAFGSGKLYTTNFLSVLITDDGRLFAGAVTPSVLEADAAARGMK
ncbi:MAG: LolA family protein [Actinocrinis sp.]